MKRILRKSLLSTAILLAASQAHGAGFQLTYQSAEGIGRANAGEGAILDSVSVGGRNPAAISFLESGGISGGLTFLKPDVKVEGKLATGQDFSHDSIANDALVPNFHYARPLSNKISLGLSLGSFYGTSTEFPEDSLVGAQTGETSLKTVNANVYGAYKLSQQLSIGAGVNLVQADATMVRRKGILKEAPLAGLGLGGNESDKIIDVEGDDMGFGWNIGALWNMNENNRFSLTYRSTVDLTIEGKFTGLASGGQSVDAKLDLELPDVLEFSGFHQLNSELAVHYSAAYTGWKSFQELKGTSDGCVVSPPAPTAGTCFIKEEKWEDSWRYALGATYGLNDMITLRGGIALDQSPVTEKYRTMSIPDADRIWYSAGATVNLNSALSVDAGISMIDGKKVEGSEVLSDSLPTQKADFSSEAKALVVSLQANYNF